MDRNCKANRRCTQNQETNTSNQNQNIRYHVARPGALFHNEPLQTNPTVANPNLPPKVCARGMQTHKTQSPQRKKETPCRARDQFEQDPTLNTYRINRDDPQYNCLNTCPSLSTELLTHVPSDLSQFTPKPRRVRRLPPFSSAIESKNDGAGGDDLLFRNYEFFPESSLDRLRKDPKAPPKSEYLGETDAFPLVTSAMRQCTARFKAKYSENDTDSLVGTPKALISEKTASDLRAVVSSQIQVQETIEQSKRKFTQSVSKRFEPLASISEESINTFSQHQSETKIDKLETGEQMDDKVEEDNFKMTVGCVDLVSTKFIAPVVRKLQHLSLRVFQEELSIIEDLERLPSQVNQVFQAASNRKNQDNQ